MTPPATPPSQTVNYGPSPDAQPSPVPAQESPQPSINPDQGGVQGASGNPQAETIDQALTAFEGLQFGGKLGVPRSPAPAIPDQQPAPLSRTPGADEQPAQPGRAANGQFTSQQPAVVPPAAQAPGYRDYSGLNAEDRPLFERMSNEAFSKLKPHYLESIKWKAELDQLRAENAEIKGKHFYEQDNAYQLTPEYQTISAEANFLDQEIGHWEQQRANIRAGRPWSRLVKDAQGNVVVESNAIEVTDDNREQCVDFVNDKLNEGRGYRNEYSARLGAFHEKFKGEHGNYVKSFDAMEQKLLGGADQAKLEKAAATKMALFPKHMQGRREIKSFAKALVVIDGLLAMLSQRNGSAATQQIVAATAASAGPTGQQVQPANGRADTVGAVQDDFERMKRNSWQS